MATQNLFEKYGIKEVADVTFYRIEKKEETFESQRTISVASILKGAVELRMVYPLNNGMGEDEGFEAYVFTNAKINDGVTYDCDNPATTHEYTYAEQACMLFAKRQNLITKTGVRYQFENTDTIFGNFVFSDQFADAPKSTNQIVVVGLSGKLTEADYDFDEIKEALLDLTTTYTAKCYDVTYTDYAELIVEDEMGYYNPAFLGKDYVRTAGVGSITFFANAAAYKAAYPNGYDAALANATMWDDGVHYSINDAIEALRQKKAAIDVAGSAGASGIDSIKGGYLVSSDEDPAPGHEDTETAANIYEYTDGTNPLEDASGNDAKSQYPLADVVNILNEIGSVAGQAGADVEVELGTGAQKSNRAIYVRVDGSVDTAESSYIYLLQNKNAKALALDNDGIFKFTDKAGNTVYYQDKIFKGVEYLALVIVGTKGMIFVVNRHGYKNFTKSAWMVSDSGYVDNRKAQVLVNAGLIHTVDIATNDETFEATCTVGGIKVHKTVKKANRYVPVLFLDTLKISTLEQSGEEVYATGGRGNANLIGWDYGKTITVTLEDALFTPASMAAIYGTYEGQDFRKGVKETKKIDRMEKCTAKRSFIVPAGNMNGTPTEAENTAQAVYYDPNTMEPYQDGTPIAEGEIFYKWTRSVAYEGQSLGNTIEISADKFPGTYKVVGDTFVRSKETGEDERFQFVIPQAKMASNQSITLQAEGDPTVFDMNLTVLRPDDGIMVKFIQYNVVENEEENDGSTMVKGTENLNLLDDAELFKVSGDGIEDEDAIGATEY